MREVEHTVKCWPQYYDAIEAGEKPFDVRRDDRGYQRGDILRSQRTRPESLHTVEYDYNGKPIKEMRHRITYVLTGGQFGIEPGFVVLGLGALTAGNPDG